MTYKPSPKEIELVKTLYLNGLGIGDIAEIANLSPYLVRKMLKVEAPFKPIVPKEKPSYRNAPGIKNRDIMVSRVTIEVALPRATSGEEGMHFLCMELIERGYGENYVEGASKPL